MKIKVLKQYQLKGERNNRPRKPLLAGDKILVVFSYDKKGFFESKIQCLKRSDFTVIWEYKHAHVINNLILQDGDRVLASCMDGKIICFNVNNGEEIWSFQITETNIGVLSNIVDHKIVVSSIQTNSGFTWCLDVNLGTIYWKQPNKGHAYIPFIDHQQIYNCIGNDIYCLNLNTGLSIWINTEPGSYIFNPKMFKSLVMVAGHGLVNFYDGSSGKLRNALNTGVRSSIKEPIEDGENIVFGDEDGFLYSYNCALVANGDQPSLNWKIDTGGNIQSFLQIKDDHVFLINNSKKLMAVDKNSGNVAAELKIKGEANSSGITIDGDKIYCSCGGGFLYECELNK